MGIVTFLIIIIIFFRINLLVYVSFAHFKVACPVCRRAHASR